MHILPTYLYYGAAGGTSGEARSSERLDEAWSRHAYQLSGNEGSFSGSPDIPGEDLRPFACSDEDNPSG